MLKQDVLEREENIAGKAENVGYQHFLLFWMFSIIFMFDI